MAILTNWSLYYNLEGEQQVRANLVYTPYVSPDGSTFCMSFNRDTRYHNNVEENAPWNDKLLDERFNREVTFYNRVSGHIPTLKVKKINSVNRTIQLEWHGDDFYMQTLKAGGYEKVLPDWQEQLKDRMRTMWQLGIRKISLHPNSWTVKDGVLIPFNWFFCYDVEEQIIIKDVLMQISTDRQKKLASVLDSNGFHFSSPYSATTIQKIALNSFRTNYPANLIDGLLQDDLLQ
jgi:hypothetical protein